MTDYEYALEVAMDNFRDANSKDKRSRVRSKVQGLRADVRHENKDSEFLKEDYVSPRGVTLQMILEA